VNVLTYVYALVRAEKRPLLRALPGAMPGGGPVRLVAPAENLWLAVSTVPAQDYGEAALEAGLQDLDWLGPRAIAHEAVVEHFLACNALLPMQLFTLFKSDDRAVEHVQRTQPEIERILGRIERHVEWGLRLTWDEQAARLAAELRHAEVGAKSGSAYLARKRDLLEVRRTEWTTARTAAEDLYQIMGRAAAASRRHSKTEEATPQSRVLLDAAFLVRAEKADAFRQQLERQEHGLAETGIVASLTGPWPPYNFV
jgi:hypothetical protein